MIGLLLLSAGIGAAVIATMKTGHPGWWARRILRHGVFVIAALVPLGILLRAAGAGRLFDGALQSAPVSIAGGVIGGGGAILLLSLFFSMPSSAVLRRALKFFVPDDPPNPVRRRIVEAVVAAIPITAAAIATAGIVGAFVSTKVVERPMKFANLPSDLEGLRILQITDLHLGAFHAPSMLPALVDAARAARPDLVLLTGDICDYVPWLETTLRHFEELDPRLGMFAVFGNHEYYRGAIANKRIYDKTKIELVIDRHRTVTVGDSKLLLVGVDDPSGWNHEEDHYARRADVALNGAPSDLFSVALCHRPKGFRALAERGIDLTLSGHTHGAQTGFAERSVLEPIANESYLWGRYEHLGKQLYTSSGAGHWAAFRLACPSEAPLVILEKA